MCFKSYENDHFLTLTFISNKFTKQSVVSHLRVTSQSSLCKVVMMTFECFCSLKAYVSEAGNEYVETDG